MKPDLKGIEPTIDGLAKYLTNLPPDSIATDNGFVADYIKSRFHVDDVFREPGRFGWVEVSQLWRDEKGFIQDADQIIQLPAELSIFLVSEEDDGPLTAQRALEAIDKIQRADGSA